MKRHKNKREAWSKREEKRRDTNLQELPWLEGEEKWVISCSYAKKQEHKGRGREMSLLVEREVENS